jgi:outer membrane protein assembly factor BamD (BamD/ComL family)
MDKDVRMLNQGWKSYALRALLLALLAGLPGCQAPRSSTAAGTPSQPAGPADDYESWLQRRAAGQESPPVQPRSDPGVQQASAQGPAAPVQTTGPNSLPPDSDQNVQNVGTSVTAAGLASIKEPKKHRDDDSDSSFDWSDLEPQAIYKQIKVAMGRGPDEAIAQSLLREGEALYKQKRYSEAAKKFAAAADRWPDSALEEDALAYQAESHFFADEYSQAHDTYVTLFKKYTNSRYLDLSVQREFQIARYWEQVHRANPHWPVTPNFSDKSRPLFDTFGNAVGAYQSVRLNDPTGPRAADAVMAEANAYFLDGRYEEAAYNYDILRKEYPKSEHQVQAHVLGLQAKQRMYQGPLYDGTPLDDAGKIDKQALTQFSNKLGSERTRMVDVQGKILEQKAERDWAMAQFYEKKKAYGAAKAYYRALMKDHPGTQAAQMAQVRLEQIKGFPDQPPNYLKWIDVILPSKRPM